MEKPMSKEEITQLAEKIYYSDTYKDKSGNIYRHVILPQEIMKYVPKNRLMEEQEWRALGVSQSRGWRHYMLHNPEPHILLFKRAPEGYKESR
ncbi:cyclin-dependent kinase regulatory subunit CKS1 [Nematocida sp. AWRm77]|nr:cyclin-dependent kinase regulatory subunit CKS1 [Nematocida sp. AWRm77]